MHIIIIKKYIYFSCSSSSYGRNVSEYMFILSFSFTIDECSFAFVSFCLSLFLCYVNVFRPKDKWYFWFMEWKRKSLCQRQENESKRGRRKKAIKEACIKLHTHGVRSLILFLSLKSCSAAAAAAAHVDAAVSVCCNEQSFYNIHIPIFKIERK